GPFARYEHDSVLDNNGDAECAQHRRQPGGPAQRAVGQRLDQDAQAADQGEGEKADDHRQGRMTGGAEQRREAETDEGACSEQLAVREVDEPQDAINHRVAECDQRIDGAYRQCIDELLESERHRPWSSYFTRVNAPFFTW